MEVIYQSHPDVVVATNTFRNVPTIIQFGDTPLLEVGKFEKVGYSVRFPVYHSDGTKIAVVVGNKIHVTPAGHNAKLEMRRFNDMDVCELEGKPILELRYPESAKLHGTAELYAPNGILIKANDKETAAILQAKTITFTGGLGVWDSTFIDCKIGIRFSTNDLAIGVGGGEVHIGYLGHPEGRPNLQENSSPLPRPPQMPL